MVPNLEADINRSKSFSPIAVAFMVDEMPARTKENIAQYLLLEPKSRT